MVKLSWISKELQKGIPDYFCTITNKCVKEIVGTYDIIQKTQIENNILGIVVIYILYL